MTSDIEPLTWEIGIPLATNPRMIKTMALVTALSVLIPVVIMSLIFGSQGDWDQIGSLVQIFVLVGLGLFVMFILIMLIVFGNRMNTRYSVSQKGILQETIDKVGVAGSRLALLAGILGRSPGTAGAGLIAMSQQAVTLDWKGGFILDPRPRRHMLISPEWLAAGDGSLLHPGKLRPGRSPGATAHGPLPD
jgi:hypothetical protein